ncbi:MAG: uroporphyrinogen decarboxylase, partial [Verrucomicrobia bacterium]|nr:uroporphyrinogen decarboxylase [Verrucomicrobiota bacterium]
MFLAALKGQNRGRPPVWLMRQAGRYMPSYQKLRARYSLRELFFTPELAADITLMPVDQLGVDAAILFSDITVVAVPLGMSLDFAEGPVIRGSVQRQPIKALEPIAKAIRLIKARTVAPLIGFCGGPYTVARYMGGQPALWEPILDVTLEYIRLQEEAGVDAIQIFDSWAGEMDSASFRAYCPYLQTLVDSARVPVIVFMRGACRYVEELVKLRAAAISFDAEQPLHLLRPKVPMAVQGNLDPDLLYEPKEIIRQKTKELLDSMQNDPGFIVNLGHGVKKDVSMDHVQ